MIGLLLGCVDAPPADDLVFLRGALLAPLGSGGRAVSGSRELVPYAWAPGEQVRTSTGEGSAPERPECVALFHVPLGTPSRWLADDETAPDTALAFSPDGERLAIGSWTGDLIVVDAWTGAELARRHLAETMVKRVAWSPDGATLYAAEQSPDAYVHALDPTSLDSRWSVRLADEVGSSAMSADDRYGVYSLPAAYALEVLDGGDLIVAAAHGWNDAEGLRHNRSRLLRLDPNGSRVAAWPPGGTADATLLQARARGDRVAVSIGRSADGPPPDLPIGGVLVLGPTLEPVSSVTLPPLGELFPKVFVWDAVDVDGDTVLAGLADGRVLVQRGEQRTLLELGTPLLSGAVPLAASVGYGQLLGDVALTATTRTIIPWGARTAAARPPSAHPNEHTVWAHGLDGALRWTWHGPHEIAGLTVTPDGRTLVVGAGARATDERQDLFGALVFDLEGHGTGEQRLVTSCATSSPVFFRHAATADGRIAVAEHPYAHARGVTLGAYQVTVLR